MGSNRTPRHLYKYRPFNVNTLRLLDLAEVYYADHGGFNDPLDCDTSIQFDTDIVSLERLLCSMLVKVGGKPNALRVMNNHRYMSTQYGDYRTDSGAAEYYTRCLVSAVDDLLKAEIGRRGVLSLAAKWNCPLMWSHYADEHRGVCIEYDMKDAAFNALQPVSYASSRGVRVSELIDWKLNKSESARKQIEQRVFFSKASQWRYEKEWRDIDSSAGASSAPAYVSAIIFGFRCDTTVINTVVKLHAHSERKIHFYAIRPRDESFRLGRIEVDQEEIRAFGIRGPAALEFRDVFFDQADA